MPPTGDRPPVDIKELSQQGLSALLAELDPRPFRAKQVWAWVWKRDAVSFDGMTNIAKELRAELAARAVIGRLGVDRVHGAQDGTMKVTFALKDGHGVEGVLIPDGSRLTACISSQVGCPLRCRFCRTGLMGFIRHLTRGEIADQVVRLQALAAPRRITNMVFMGMGEPLMNMEGLLGALELILSPEALAFSHRRVTVSTAGVVPAMAELGQRANVNLAVSLNATTDEVRSELMPVNRRYPLAALMEACRAYPLPKRSRITFEYVMLRGVNDSPEDARRLNRLLAGIPSKINLIPFNPFPDCALAPSSPEALAAFQDILIAAGRNAIIRESRGRDALAACGQLYWARG